MRPNQYVVLIDYNCYYSSPRKRCGLWISGWRLRKAPENETKKPETPFPISVDNLFLKIWSDHDPHVMKRDGCKVPFKSERIKERFCVQLKQRKSMMPIIAPLCCGCQRADAGPQPGGYQRDPTAVENQLMSGPYKQLARAYMSTVTIATLNVKNAVA